MNTLPYFLNASLYLLLFYGCYWLLLRRNTFFGLNRMYLLLSVGLSVMLPLVSLPNEWSMSSQTTGGTVTLPTFVVGANTAAQTNGLTTDQWFWLIYGLGVAVMLVRLSLNGRAVFRLIRSGSVERGREYTLVRLSNDCVPSFSFGRYLVLNQTDAQTEPDALLRHEEAHIHQRHTADILFIEIVRAAFWFNPMLLLYKRSLQEVHEFLADEAVAQTAPRPDYAQQLVAYALNVPSAVLTTPFVSVSTLKQRIVMLQKPQTHRRALLSYALVLPLAGLLTLCTQPDRDQPQSEAGLAKARTAVKPVKVEGKIFDAVEESPTFPGGMKKLGEFLGQNLKYPIAAEKAKAEGPVFVNFVLTKEGDITDVKILKGIGFGADEEAVRVMNQMPRWNPAKHGGKEVNVRYNLPIRFQLENEDGDKTAFGGAKHFTIDGKKATEEQVSALSPNSIGHVDINHPQGMMAITTK
ncbi:M56 family metallopeptidase [Spirosoma arcticum]